MIKNLDDKYNKIEKVKLFIKKFIEEHKNFINGLVIYIQIKIYIFTLNFLTQYV